MATGENKAARILLFILIFLLILLLSALAATGGTKERDRAQMVERDIKGRGIRDPAVLRAMASVQRHLFVDGNYRDEAYADHPLPIGEGQTISQPYVVALMTEVLRLKPSDRVLEVGTGSGYQAAVLSTIAKEVYTIEIIKPLADRAQKLLADLGYGNVAVKFGDGYLGWTEHAPFDAIIITAAAGRIPTPLASQLREGGRLVMPLGNTIYSQTLILATKRDGKLEVREIAPVAFVPMTGEVNTER